MKKTILFALVSIMTTLGVNAQTNTPPYTQSKYYNPATGRLDYRPKFMRSEFAPDGVYYGFRVGLALSTITSDDNAAKASDMRSGINLGAVIGCQLTNQAPLYLESGLYYTRKGGNAKLEGSSLKYGLEYFEIPVTCKYDAELIDDLHVQPFLGVYGALGVGGKVKDFKNLQALSSFGDYFNRFDGGLRLGCGLSYAPFYAELAYDFGLTNISRGDFYDAHTRSLQLNIGVNF